MDKYVRVCWPESQKWMVDEYENDIEHGADDCVVFVPEDLYNEVNGNCGMTLVELRSLAFDMANSGKYGEYPYDETFNDAVEEGFSEDGTTWTAKDGTIISI